MKCSYKLQCSTCLHTFNVEVDTSVAQPYYSSNCPQCGKKIKIRIAKQDQLTSFQVSKSSHVEPKIEKGQSDEAIAERITFKCVRKIPQEEQRPKGFQPKKDKDMMESSDSSKRTQLPPREIRQLEDLLSSSTSSIPVSFPHQTKKSTAFFKGPNEVPPEVSKPPRQSKTPGRYKKIEEPVAEVEPYKFRRPVRRIKRRSPPGYFVEPRGPPPQKKPQMPNIIRDPDKRLGIASVLLLIVFILGIAHGAMSLMWGTPDNISSEQASIKSVDIDGCVIDFHTGRPIPNCVVRISETNQRDLTNSDGYYFISNVDVGDIEVVADAQGYAKVVKKVTVASEQPASFNFELKPGVAVEEYDETSVVVQEGGDSINIFAVLIILLACFAILAILLIRQRTMFKICILSTFLCLFSFGAGVGFLLGIFALILILFSSSSFKPKIDKVIEELDNSSKK